MKVNFFQKILSRFYPVTIERLSSNIHPELLLQFFKNEWLLETGTALYSKGLSYAPFQLAFKHISNEIQSCKTFLLLGTGLGSALYILQDKYNVYPSSTLVDYDEEILNLSQKVLPINKENTSFICDDAFDFLKVNESKYDLIGIDVFKDMTNAQQIFYPSFFESLNARCHKSTICIINSIIDTEADEKNLVQEISKYFKHECLAYRRNKIYILKPI